MISSPHAPEVRWQDSAIPAALNGLINGAIAWFSFKAQSSVPISVDLISARQHTVWGQGTMLAFALGLILTVVTWKVYAAHLAKSHPEWLPRVQRPLFPDVARIALRNTLLLFGVFVLLAVLWQRLVGSVEVGPGLAASLVGLLAAAITAVVEVRTKRELLHV
ncbi:MAG: permease [Rhodanobacteraceae bacterium]|jgi:hypothetical protein|nr:permease [Rhodanobacteraceae bacterium]